MKQLDKLLARSFLGPFVVTFGIAIFVLLMQILWLYLDDIAGKGLGFFVVMELLAYKCVGLVPLALPLALLISSVMVLGGMAEHYELSSFKSAGVSLFRVMRPLILFGILSSGVSYFCSDYVIPAANLQFGARMYDIQQKKPTLSMEPGVFNEDFSQFAIRLGERDNNGRDIRDVLIYDHSKAATGELVQITASNGEMYSSDDGNFFIMRLFDGFQYLEQRPGGRNGQNRPFIRTKFDTYTKVFDLSEFNLQVTNAKLFATNRSMLATWQLQEGVDSIDLDIAIRKQTISNHLTSYLPLLKKDTTVYRESWTRKQEQEAAAARDSVAADTARQLSSIAETVEAEDLPPTRPPRATQTPSQIQRIDNRSPEKMVTDQTALDRTMVTRELEDRQQVQYQRALKHPLVRGATDWPGIESMMDSLENTIATRVYNRSRSAIRSVTSQAQAAQRIIPGVEESRVKHIYDLHMKYSMALVCIIFIFIGAPMGAIVRKGGFGYPILVSIIFFVIFIILTILCRKLAESFVVTGAVAGWLPCVVLFPMSLYITRRAMRDAKLVSTDGLSNALTWIQKRFRKDKPKPTTQA
ncbi:LptF/LptG family permease [Lewinella sp. W8]|uniref:LptF/LptG family permease n=1 Tax=Lewinella sp. W8 TaxID=2528208 RepID=UPI0010683279|nr:LptF/LptG family permease [Lewinella sp. W8]MTB50472.1 LptF/LptG family permease [Lewinella sp. W8]